MGKGRIVTRQKLSSKAIKTDPPELETAVEMVGLFSRVARKLDLTPSHVIAVAKKRRQSSRVVVEIVKEVRRLGIGRAA